MSITIISDGEIEIRADFAQASCPIQFRLDRSAERRDGDEKDGWLPTPFQVANAAHDADRALALVNDWADAQS